MPRTALRVAVCLLLVPLLPGASRVPSARQFVAPVTAARPPAGSTSGRGAFDVTAPGASVRVEFEFTATAEPGGQARGTFRQSRALEGGTADFSGRVTCLSVDPATRRAWIGGVVTENRSTHPSFQVDSLHAAGRDVWFRVVDYGEGADAPLDRSTVLGFRWAAGFVTSTQYCAARPWPDDDARTWPLTQGSIAVLP